MTFYYIYFFIHHFYTLKDCGENIHLQKLTDQVQVLLLLLLLLLFECNDTAGVLQTVRMTNTSQILMCWY